MFQELIAIILVILIINVFLIFAIRNVSKKISDHMRKCTLNNLKAYNNVIEEKQNELDRLNEQISELKSEIETLESKNEKNTSSQTVVTSINSGVNTTEYEDEHFFNNYSFIRKNFNMNYKSVVQDFVFDNIEKDTDLYELYKSVLSKISLDCYYELLKYDNEVRESKLMKILSNKEITILEEYIKENENFDLTDFYNYVQRKVALLDPTIVIKGNENFKYLEKIDKRIRVEVDKSIIEGIKILYRGKIFDYSL